MKSLKISLWICAIGCLTALPFTVFPVPMTWFGLKPIPDIPEIMYFIRIACGVFGLIGIYFIILARNPLGYGAMLNLGAYGLIAFGLLGLILGLSLKIPLIVYLGDALFGIVLGSVIAILSSKIQRGLKDRERKRH
ncbi:MAG: hypothetical protein AB4426_17330 [Xenococcaceae cyanobacterium]